MPLPHGFVDEVLDVVVVTVNVVEVVTGGWLVVVVLGDGQPFGPHASQQLGTSLAHALPPGGALHAAALGLVVQRVRPFLSVRQQETASSSLPQVDFMAHRTTDSRHSGRSS
jgi:hypothetical protein